MKRLLLLFCAAHPGEGIIWARSAWAGSQRYALHWGGDAATTNTGTAHRPD